MLTYRGVPLGWGAGSAVAGKQRWVQLSKAEEPEDRHWTATVVAAD